MDDSEDSIVFDFIRGYGSRISLNLKFTRIVDTGYEISKAALGKFHKFLKQFDYNEVDEEIDGCYNLFLLAFIGPAGMNSTDLGAAFEFAVKYGPQELLEDVFQMIEPSMDRTVRALDLYGLKWAAEFMFKTALNSKKLILMNRVYYFIYSSIKFLH
jgi:hypothetical protein